LSKFRAVIFLLGAIKSIRSYVGNENLMTDSGVTKMNLEGNGSVPSMLV